MDGRPAKTDHSDDASDRLDSGRGLIYEKWGGAVSGGKTGYQAVPDALLRGQCDLGITEIEMVVLLNVTMHWWRADRLPFMRVSTIAKRMGKSERTVQRALSSLVNKGILMREKKWPAAGESMDTRRRMFNPAPLAKKLDDIAIGIKHDEQEQEPGE